MEFKYLCRTRLRIPKDSLVQLFLRESSVFWNSLLDEVGRQSHEYVFDSFDGTPEVARDMSFKAVIFEHAEALAFKLSLGKACSLYMTSYMFRANDLYEAYRGARSEEGVQRESSLPRKKHSRSSHSVRFMYGDYVIDPSDKSVSFKNWANVRNISDGVTSRNIGLSKDFRLESLDTETLEEIVEKRAMMTVTTRRLQTSPVKAGDAPPRRRSSDIDDLLPAPHLLEYTITFSCPVLETQSMEVPDIQEQTEEKLSEEKEGSKSAVSKIVAFFKNVSINDGKKKTFIQSLSTNLFDLQPKLLSELGESFTQREVALITSDIENFARDRIERASAIARAGGH